MNVGRDRLVRAGAIVCASVLAAALSALAWVLTGEAVLSNLSIAVVVVGSVVFAPTYLLYAAWFDEFGDRRS